MKLLFFFCLAHEQLYLSFVMFNYFLLIFHHVDDIEVIDFFPSISPFSHLIINFVLLLLDVIMVEDIQNMYFSCL